MTNPNTVSDPNEVHKLNVAQRLGRAVLGLAEIGGGLITQGVSVSSLGWLPPLAVAGFFGGFALEAKGLGHIVEAFAGTTRPAPSLLPGENVTHTILAAGEVAAGAAEVALGTAVLSTGLFAPIGATVVASGLAQIGEGIADINGMLPTFTPDKTPIEA